MVYRILLFISVLSMLRPRLRNASWVNLSFKFSIRLLQHIMECMSVFIFRCRSNLFEFWYVARGLTVSFWSMDHMKKQIRCTVVSHLQSRAGLSHVFFLCVKCKSKHTYMKVCLNSQSSRHVKVLSLEGSHFGATMCANKCEQLI